MSRTPARTSTPSSASARTVTSADGTRIAYDVYGPVGAEPVILVGGAFSYRSFPDVVKLAELLGDRFRVVSYDRRGRGDSGDTAPFAIERETDDLAALVEAVGGPVHLYGLSSGAALALNAAAARPDLVRSLALYEAPFLVDDTGTALTPETLAHVQHLVDTDRRGPVVKVFMREVGVPAAFVHLMPLLPAWRRLKAVAHTLPYDFAQLDGHRSGRPYPAGRWATATMPTLVIDGGKSPASMRTAMAALADHLPAARYRTLEGQTHVVAPAALAPVLADFFAAHPVARTRSQA